MASLILVPALLVSSAAFFVLSCNAAIFSDACRSLDARSAFTASSLSDASSGFQWPEPFFCLARESLLCRS